MEGLITLLKVFSSEMERLAKLAKLGEIERERYYVNRLRLEEYFDRLDRNRKPMVFLPKS